MRRLEASVTRNAGGRAMDALRSLIVLDNLAPIGVVIVVHHTGSFIPLFRIFSLRGERESKNEKRLGFKCAKWEEQYEK